MELREDHRLEPIWPTEEGVAAIVEKYKGILRPNPKFQMPSRWHQKCPWARRRQRQSCFLVWHSSCESDTFQGEL